LITEKISGAGTAMNLSPFDYVNDICGILIAIAIFILLPVYRRVVGIRLVYFLIGMIIDTCLYSAIRPGTGSLIGNPPISNGSLK
jgi:hypothetical protein